MWNKGKKYLSLQSLMFLKLKLIDVHSSFLLLMNFQMVSSRLFAFNIIF